MKAARLALAGAVLAQSVASDPPARASVSPAALFDDLVKESSAVALVTPVEQRADWEGNRIVTLTRAHVDRVVAGQLPGDGGPWVSVRTLGGNVGRIGQIVEGQATFAVGAASLVFLRPHVDRLTGAVSTSFVVVDSAQGQFPIARGDGKTAKLARAGNVGALVEPATKPAGARLAREVLEERAVDDAAREIAAAFRRLH